MMGFFLGAGAVAGGAAPDVVAPSVSSVSIEDDETDGTFVRVTFGEDIPPESLVLGLISLTVNAVGRGISTPTWASASVLEIATDSPVYAGQTCLLTLAAGAVEDLAGNANELQSDIAVDNNSTRGTYPLDLVGGTMPEVAYATKKLTAAYSGNCMRIERPSDSATLDVGFVGQSLDTAAIATFLGSETGRARVLYDQSGNGRDTPDGGVGVGPTLRFENLIGGLPSLLWDDGYLSMPASVAVNRLSCDLWTVTDLYGSNQSCGLIQAGTGAEAMLARVSEISNGSSQVVLTPYTNPQKQKTAQTRAMPYEFYFSSGGKCLSGDELLQTINQPADSALTGGYVGYTGTANVDKGWGSAHVVYGRVLDGTERPAMREALAELFDTELNPTTRVFIEGDSITAHGPADYGWVKQMLPQLSRQTHVYNLSRGNAEIAQEVTNYSLQMGDVLADYPTDDNIVFLYIGTNDLTDSFRTAAQIWGDIQTYCAAVRAQGARIIVATMTPDGAWDATQQTTWNDANTLIRAGEGVDYDLLCDFQADTVMGPFAAAADLTLYNDGLHPTTLGFSHLATEAAVAVNALLADSVKPTVSGTPSINAAGDTLTITFSEPMNPLKVPSTVTLGGTSAAFASASWASSTALAVTLSPTVIEGETVTYSLAAGSVRDLVGNANAAITSQATSNLSEVPAAFTPGQLGTVASHITGDSATFARSGSLVYSSLTDSGTLGGTWAAATNLHPVAVTANSKTAAQFRAGRRAQSSVAASSWDMFSNATGAASLSVIFYPYAIGSAMTLWHGSSANSRGCNVRIDAAGGVDVDFANGTTTTTLNDVGTVSANAWHVLQLTKDAAGNILARLNGGTDVTGSFTPSNGAPAAAPQIGSNGTDHFFGIIAQVVVHLVELDSTGLGQMRVYLTDRWSAAPGYSPLKDTNATDVAAWYRAGQVLIDVGAEADYDESGHNNHRAQTTDANQPTLVADWEGTGYPALQSDGTDRISTAATFTQGTLAQPVTHYLAVQANSQVVARDIFDGAGTNRQIIRLATTDAITVFSGGGGAPTIGITMLENLRSVIRCVMSASIFNFRLAQDGQSDAVSTTAAGLGTGGLDGLHSFGRQDGINMFNGEIAEHIVFAGVAGSATAASDAHDLEMRSKYSV